MTDFAHGSIGFFVVGFVRRVVVLQVDTLIYSGVLDALFGVVGRFLSFGGGFWRLLCGILGLLSSLAWLRSWWELGGFGVGRIGALSFAGDALWSVSGLFCGTFWGVGGAL